MTNPQAPTLEDLLRRWAELEPERCAEWGENDPPPDGTLGFWVFIKELGDTTSVHPEDPIDVMVIQGIVQFAIEARGWNWHVEYGNIGYRAQIFTVLGPTNELPTAAHALLTAYLQALEPHAP